jgi:hypothetical protein
MEAVLVTNVHVARFRKHVLKEIQTVAIQVHQEHARLIKLKYRNVVMIESGGLFAKTIFHRERPYVVAANFQEARV